MPVNSISSAAGLRCCDGVDTEDVGKLLAVDVAALADISTFLLRIILISWAPRPVRWDEGLGLKVGLLLLLVNLRSGGDD